MPTPLPELQLSHGQALKLLWNEAWGGKEPTKTFRAYVIYLRNLGVPQLEATGRGVDIRYSYEQLMELRLALEMRYRGLTIKEIGELFKQIRPDLHKHFHKALQGQNHTTTIRSDKDSHTLEGYFLDLGLSYSEQPDPATGGMRLTLLTTKPRLLDGRQLLGELESLGRKRSFLGVFALTQMAQQLANDAPSLPEIRRGRR